MKRTIILCTILMLVAVVGVNAQSRNYNDKPSDINAKKESHTKVMDNKTTPTKTVDSKTTQTKAVNNSGNSTQTSKVTVKKPATTSAAADKTIKMGAHAPASNDANYATKFAEWQKNYPDEYKAYFDSQRNASFK